MDNSVDLTVAVIAKECRPGRVKTRLSPPLSPEHAAALAQASLSRTLETVRLLPVRNRILVMDGTPSPADAAGFTVVPQATGGLDERLAGNAGRASPHRGSAVTATGVASSAKHIAPNGTLLGEVEADENLATVTSAVLEDSRGNQSAPFHWARTGSAGLASRAQQNDWTVSSVQRLLGRGFCRLSPGRRADRTAA